MPSLRPHRKYSLWIAELNAGNSATALEFAKQTLSIKLGRLRQPVGLRNRLLRHDDEGRHARAGRGRKVWLFKLGETRLIHSLKRELTLFACPHLKPRLPLLHVAEADAKAGPQCFIH